MRFASRSLLPLLLALPLGLLHAAGAAAQQTCDQCSPFASCGESCTYCWIYSYDGCQYGQESTCGAHGEACMQAWCTPNYVETSRELRGTYGNGATFSCSHHKVEWVTRVDTNQCNTSSAYWTVSTCEDSLDGGKSGFRPDCCNGYGPGGGLDSTYTCNHQHSC